MAGVVLAVGTMAAATALTVGLGVVSQATVSAQQLTGAADAAALAAADTASGALTGVPCEAAAEVALASGTALADCVLDGLVATITVGGSVLGLAATATARAGPPS